jgi:hypothetical protein
MIYHFFNKNKTNVFLSIGFNRFLLKVIHWLFFRKLIIGGLYDLAV